MTTDYDEFLEAQCMAEEFRGRTPTTINLIAALREHDTMGLKEGKDIVDDFLRRREPHTIAPIVLDYDVFLAERIAAMEANQEKPDRLNLIKDLREQTPLGLREAKDIVDDFCKRNHPEMPTSSGEGIHDPGFLSTVAKMLGL